MRYMEFGNRYVSMFWFRYSATGLSAYRPTGQWGGERRGNFTAPGNANAHVITESGGQVRVFGREITAHGRTIARKTPR